MFLTERVARNDEIIAADAQQLNAYNATQVPSHSSLAPIGPRDPPFRCGRLTSPPVAARPARRSCWETTSPTGAPRTPSPRPRRLTLAAETALPSPAPPPHPPCCPDRIHPPPSAGSVVVLRVRSAATGKVEEVPVRAPPAERALEGGGRGRGEEGGYVLL